MLGNSVTFGSRFFNKEIEMSKQWDVVIPIAGHVYKTVEADSAEEAIEKAMGEVSIDDIGEWEALERFNQGNVCYCPSPWEADATEVEED
jgi:hypothetical protein